MELIRESEFADYPAERRKFLANMATDSKPKPGGLVEVDLRSKLNRDVETPAAPVEAEVGELGDDCRTLWVDIDEHGDQHKPWASRQ